MFLSRVVVAGSCEVVGDAMFIRLNMTTRLAFLAEGDDKRVRQHVTHFFIKVRVMRRSFKF